MIIVCHLATSFILVAAAAASIDATQSSFFFRSGRNTHIHGHLID